MSLVQIGPIVSTIAGGVTRTASQARKYDQSARRYSQERIRSGRDEADFSFVRNLMRTLNRGYMY